LKLLW